MIRWGIPPLSHQNRQDMTRSEYLITLKWIWHDKGGISPLVMSLVSPLRWQGGTIPCHVEVDCQYGNEWHSPPCYANMENWCGKEGHSPPSHAELENQHGKEGCSPPGHAEVGNQQPGKEGRSPPSHAEMENRHGKRGCSPPGHVGISTWQGGTQPSLSCRNGLSMGVGVARLVRNRAEMLDFVDGRGGDSIRESTSPKIKPGHSILWVVG